MMRLGVLILLACSLFSNATVAQPANRKDCLPADPSCSDFMRGIAAIGSVALAPASGAGALKGERPGIAVAPFTLVEPGGRARLQIQVGPLQALPKNSFVRIRGLPPSIAVSQGHAIAPGVWAIPVAALPDLTIGAPEGFVGWSEIAITVVVADGPVLAEAKTKLVIASRSNDVAPAGARVSLTPEDHERALQFHAQGVEQLRIGNIVAARKFFALAAESDLAPSVMALAATYDPHELGKFGAFGPLPDADAALRWYRKARELGVTDAEQRLQRLEAR
jgi:hypothetical protein